MPEDHPMQGRRRAVEEAAIGQPVCEGSSEITDDVAATAEDWICLFAGFGLLDLESGRIWLLR